MATIHNLPDEILLYICSFIPSRELIMTVCSVCRRFQDLLYQEWYWRSRYVSCLSGAPTGGMLEGMRRWQLGCIHAEFVLAVATKTAKCRQFKGASAGLDCVRIMSSSVGGGAVVAGGSRDTLVYVWRQRHVGGASGEESGSGGRSMRDTIKASLKGHRGWVWSLAADRRYRPNVLCSGSWDHNVNIWDINTGECAYTIRSQHRAAVLSLHMPSPDMLVSACQDRHVRVLDLRTPITVAASHRTHRRSALCVSASSDYVYSGGEDRMLCVWDVRKEAVLQQITLPGIIPSLHLNCGILSVATSRQADQDKIHEVHLYDTSQGLLHEIGSFDTGHSRAVTQVVHSLAMIATASKDGTVRLHNTDLAGPHLLACPQQAGGGEVTGLDYYRSTLAIPHDRVVEVWSEV